MSHKKWIFLIPLLLLGIAALIARPVAASPQPQVVYQTPTARADGRVMYVVQDKDTCMRIQLLTGTTIDTLRTLNKLDQNCTITPGQELLLMVVTPVASPTINPKQSPFPPTVTPTPVIGNGKICVLLYNDINGDAVREDNEPALSGGAASITDKPGRVSKTVNSPDALDPVCEEVPEGDYSISMAIPGGYNPTIAMNAQVKVLAGDQAILEFGAQASAKVEEPTQTQPVSENNLMLAMLGGLLVVGGIGLGGFVLFRRR